MAKQQSAMKVPKPRTVEIGRNVVATREGNILTLSIDLSEDAEPSGSGKTLIVGTSQGNKKVDDEWFVGLNVYRYAEKKKGKR